MISRLSHFRVSGVCRRSVVVLTACCISSGCLPGPRDWSELEELTESAGGAADEGQTPSDLSSLDSVMEAGEGSSDGSTGDVASGESDASGSSESGDSDDSSSGQESMTGDGGDDLGEDGSVDEDPNCGAAPGTKAPPAQAPWCGELDAGRVYLMGTLQSGSSARDVIFDPEDPGLHCAAFGSEQSGKIVIRPRDGRVLWHRLLDPGVLVHSPDPLEWRPIPGGERPRWWYPEDPDANDEVLATNACASGRVAGISLHPETSAVSYRCGGGDGLDETWYSEYHEIELQTTWARVLGRFSNGDALLFDFNPDGRELPAAGGLFRLSILHLDGSKTELGPVGDGDVPGVLTVRARGDGMWVVDGSGEGEQPALWWVSPAEIRREGTYAGLPDGVSVMGGDDAVALDAEGRLFALARMPTGGRDGIIVRELEPGRSHIVYEEPQPDPGIWHCIPETPKVRIHISSLLTGP